MIKIFGDKWQESLIHNAAITIVLGFTPVVMTANGRCCCSQCVEPLTPVYAPCFSLSWSDHLLTAISCVGLHQ